MPQTRGNVSWFTNNRIEPVERKIRTESLKSHLENRSLSNLSLKNLNSIIDKKYRSQADLDFEIRKAKKEANKVFFQAKLINEINDEWFTIIQQRKSILQDTNNENKTDGNEDNSICRSTRYSAISVKQTPSLDNYKRLVKSAKLTREKLKSSDYLETYSRSYNYLRKLVEIDHLTRNRFQKYYDLKLIDTKVKQEQTSLVLKNKLNAFYSGVDEFVKKNNKITFDEQGRKDKIFLESLKMPDFSILLP